MFASLKRCVFSSHLVLSSLPSSSPHIAAATAPAIAASAAAISFSFLRKHISTTLSNMGVDIIPISAGDGQTYPKNGQTAVVHYTGTLENGTVFDSSRTRGKPFRFTIGQGEVIRGWDEGVAKLSVGERAKLVCSADYAYGSRGHPGVIPPNAVLTFDVELIKVE